ncbi:MAG: F0F1 ATP synthase subunit B [Chloroflexi bacterium]|nr:F0F1 ATP synthase subunit B [Chloroflexota bacterium]
MEALDALGINLGLLIIYIVNVLVVLIVLRVAAFGPISEMLEKRRERIAEGLNNARKAEEALASAEADRQKEVEAGREEGQRIISEARSRAEEVAAQIKAAAEEDARRAREAGEADAAGARERALADMRDQIVALSMAAAQHLLGEELDEAKQRELVKGFFTSVPAEAKALSGELDVITAVPLTDAEKSTFQAELNGDPINFVVEPSILGGVIIRAEGEQVDASFASKLAGMRAALA